MDGINKYLPELISLILKCCPLSVVEASSWLSWGPSLEEGTWAILARFSTTFEEDADAKSFSPDTLGLRLFNVISSESLFVVVGLLFELEIECWICDEWASIGWPFLNQSQIFARGWPKSEVTHSSKASVPAWRIVWLFGFESITVVWAGLSAAFSIVLRNPVSLTGRTNDGPAS